MPESAPPIRVLAIHAHPDDIEFQCAGTLALLREIGCHLTLATMTPGDCGSVDRDAATIAAVRRAEAQAAAEVLGAEYVCLEFRDMAVFNDDESRRRVVEAIRRARPDVILTAPPVDYHPDHEATSILVRDACFATTLPNYKTRQWEPAPVLDRIPHLYFVDPLGGRDRDHRPVPPDFRIDVTRFSPLKRQMLACHASQRDWLFKQHGIDEYLDALTEWDQERGQAIGVAAAEGFRQYLGHPYPQTNLLLDLVQQQGVGQPHSSQSAPIMNLSNSPQVNPAN